MPLRCRPGRRSRTEGQILRPRRGCPLELHQEPPVAGRRPLELHQDALWSSTCGRRRARRLLCCRPPRGQVWRPWWEGSLELRQEPPIRAGLQQRVARQPEQLLKSPVGRLGRGQCQALRLLRCRLPCGRLRRLLPRPWWESLLEIREDTTQEPPVRAGLQQRVARLPEQLLEATVG